MLGSRLRGASVGSWRPAAAVFALCAGLGCGDRAPPPAALTSQGAAPERSAEIPASAPLPATASAIPAEPALGGEPFVSLTVPGFGDAVVAVPIGARGKLPIVVAAHGNFDRPEWQCEVWAGIVGAAAFVLCPRGERRPDSPGKDDVRYTYRSNQELEREVDAALAALRGSPYAGHLAAGPPVWAGFSLGAIMGVAIAARRPADFPVLVLIEGGVDRFGEDVARAYAKGGGARVLFACAQPGCAGAARKRAARLEQLGLVAQVVDAGNVGHTYDGEVASAVKAALPDLLRGDPRFAPAAAQRAEGAPSSGADAR